MLSAAVPPDVVGNRSSGRAVVADTHSPRIQAYRKALVSLPADYELGFGRLPCHGILGSHEGGKETEYDHREDYEEESADDFCLGSSGLDLHLTSRTFLAKRRGGPGLVQTLLDLYCTVTVTTWVWVAPLAKVAATVMV